jgi:hypothetical protein
VHIFKFCTIQKSIFAANERPFGHRTKGFFAFWTRAVAQTSDGILQGTGLNEDFF